MVGTGRGGSREPEPRSCRFELFREIAEAARSSGSNKLAVTLGSSCGRPFTSRKVPTPRRLTTNRYWTSDVDPIDPEGRARLSTSSSSPQHWVLYPKRYRWFWRKE